MSEPYPSLFIPLHKHAMNIRRFAAGRENTAASFGDHFQTQLIEKIDQIAVEKAGKGLPKKWTRIAEMGNEVAYVGNIGDIATALSGNTKLETGPFHFFKQQRIRACLGSLPRGHEACRATADDNHASCNHIQQFCVN
jgi:hypothetical protein